MLRPCKQSFNCFVITVVLYHSGNGRLTDALLGAIGRPHVGMYRRCVPRKVALQNRSVRDVCKRDSVLAVELMGSVRAGRYL